MSVKKDAMIHIHILNMDLFTCIIKNGEKRSQCVICNKVQTNDSLNPTKLKQHLHNVHQQLKNKNKFF